MPPPTAAIGRILISPYDRPPPLSELPLIFIAAVLYSVVFLGLLPAASRATGTPRLGPSGPGKDQPRGSSDLGGPSWRLWQRGRTSRRIVRGDTVAINSIALLAIAFVSLICHVTLLALSPARRRSDDSAACAAAPMIPPPAPPQGRDTAEEIGSTSGRPPCSSPPSLSSFYRRRRCSFLKGGVVYYSSIYGNVHQ